MLVRVRVRVSVLFPVNFSAVVLAGLACEREKEKDRALGPMHSRGADRISRKGDQAAKKLGMLNIKGTGAPITLHSEPAHLQTRSQHLPPPPLPSEIGTRTPYRVTDALGEGTKPTVLVTWGLVRCPPVLSRLCSPWDTSMSE